MFYNLLQDNQQWFDEIGLYRFIQVLHQLEFRAFFAVLCSFVIVVLFGNRVIRWLLRQKVGDAPEFYNADLNQIMANKANTPTMGGLLICGAIMATVLLLGDLRNGYIRIGCIVLVVLALLGGFDDWLKLTSARKSAGSREGLLAWEKLIFQLGIGAIAAYFVYQQGTGADDHVLVWPFQRTYTPGDFQLEPGVLVLSVIPFVVIGTLLIAGTSNAVNLTDGMDGLAPGTVAVAAFAMMVLCYIAGNDDAARHLLFPRVEGTEELMVLTGAMAGACLGFLWFNCSPALVFMGDTGSLPLGGVLDLVSVAIRQEVLLLVIGGVFFLEMASVILQVGYFKLSGGKRIFRCAPIHHHYQLGGWSETQVVTRFWVLAVVLAMLALVSIKLR